MSSTSDTERGSSDEASVTKGPHNKQPTGREKQEHICKKREKIHLNFSQGKKCFIQLDPKQMKALPMKALQSLSDKMQALQLS
jgi:hypothetical protein